MLSQAAYKIASFAAGGASRQSSGASVAGSGSLEADADVTRWLAELKTVKAVRKRCRRLNRHLKLLLSNQDDARLFFSYLPQVMVELLGSEETRGWLDDCLIPEDVEALTELMSPQGAMMEGIIAFIGDPAMHYEFPVARLPPPTQRVIEGGGDVYSSRLSPLYINLLRSVSKRIAENRNQMPKDIYLNAYEFFMFCFVYYIASFGTMGGSSGAAGGGAAGISKTPKSPKKSTVGASVVGGYSLSLARQVDLPRSYKSDFYLKLNQLFLKAFVPSKNNPTPVTAAHYAALAADRALQGGMGMGGGGAYDGPQREAATFIWICIEFWLNQADYADAGHLAHTTEFHMPSKEVLCALTYMVKHINRDADVGNEDRIAAALNNRLGGIGGSGGGGGGGMGGAGSLRRSPTARDPGMAPSLLTESQLALQPVLYRFLRVVYRRMPIDGPVSVRYVARVWLNYIRPWKCQDVSFTAAQWDYFLAYNFLFYTEVTEDFLGIALNFNLSTGSGKDLRLLADVTSSFSADVVDRLIAIERLTQNPERLFGSRGSPLAGGVGGGSGGGGLGGAAAAPGDESLNHYYPAIRAHFATMEGRRYVYQPRLGPGAEVPDVVIQLLRSLQLAAQTLDYEAAESSRFSLFSAASPDRKMPLSERRGLIVSITTNLRRMYSLGEADASAADDEAYASRSFRMSAPDIGRHNRRLTPMGVAQVRRGVRQCSNMEEIPVYLPRGAGESDIPLASKENAAVARCCFRISRRCNRYLDLPRPAKTVGTPLRLLLSLCDRMNKLFGVPVDRAVFIVRRDPVTGERVPEDRKRKARVNLRFLASYSLHYFVALVIIIAWLLKSVLWG